MSSRFLRFIYRGAAPGQAIVIMALAMVALLAALGLAIDGGGLLLLQRNAQNATDAAVLAATYARCTNAATTAEQAALDAAAANGFNDDGVTNWVTVNYPPATGSGVGDDRYMEVIITANKPAYFIQLVYHGPLQVTVRAVGYCSPAFDPFTMPPIWAGSTVCNNTVNWTGAGARIDGGTAVVPTVIHSNNEVTVGGGGQDITVDGLVRAVGAVDPPDDTSKVTYDPTPISGIDPQTYPVAYEFRDFMPTGSVAKTLIEEGWAYTTIGSDDVDFRNGTWAPDHNRVLEGVYYVEGDIDLGNNVSYTVEGATFVATGTITSRGPSFTYYTHALGLLMMSGAESRNCGDNVINVTGSSNNWYGVIFAPFGGINISASDSTIYGAIVADTIDISGSRLVFHADPTMIPPRPPLVQIAE